MGLISFLRVGFVVGWGSYFTKAGVKTGFLDDVKSW
jgi:hypothetical protein